MNDERTRRAVHFATQAHARIDQRRKYTGQPYDVHLKAVAGIVSTVTDDPATIVAAWLHDVVEDTPATFQELEREFGQEIAQLVAELSDVSRPADGNRAARRAIDRAHLAQASPRAQTVKLADLIDNVPDICRHDARFGRVYVREAAWLLDVLRSGDERLQKRAAKMVSKWAGELGVDTSLATGEEAIRDERLMPPQPPGRSRAWLQFARVFSAGDVADPLRSFDGDRPAAQIGAQARTLGLGLIGLRRDGRIAGYALTDSLGQGSFADCARPIARGQLIDGDASLTEVIRVLTRHDHGFVTLLGEISAVVSRETVQTPLVRMWLFGMVTLIEMTLVDRIRQRWSGEDWTGHLARSRLDHARKLQAERERRGQRCDLLDCLQLGDKATIVLKAPEELQAFGFESRGAAKRVIADLQSLRNHLAHSQDIVTHDWSQIARMTARVEAMVAGGFSEED